MISSSYFVEGIVVDPRITQSCTPRIRLGSSVWQNPINRYCVVAEDIDSVGPADYQALQDWLDENGEYKLPSVKPSGDPYVDVDGDGYVTNNDLILLSNYINDGVTIDRTDEECYTLNTFSVERDLFTPTTGLLARDVGLRVGAYPLSNYRVFKRNFSTKVLSEVELTTPASVKDSIVFIHRDLFKLPDCTPVEVPGRVENKPFDILLLFDDTGSFAGVAPLLIDVFADTVTTLQQLLPEVDFAFGVARFEDYRNPLFGGQYDRPFILNQPILSTAHPLFNKALIGALNRTAPGNGADLPESTIEALFQVATGNGFDGDGNGTTSDNGVAGSISTQLIAGTSGDVPAYSSFVEDLSYDESDPLEGPVITASGTLGGVGFRADAVHMILLATDAAFAYEPDGATTYVGKEVKVPASNVTFDGRGSTPDGRGAKIQETIDALIALDCQVVGLGTSAIPGTTPRMQLEAISTLTGAIYNGDSELDSGIEGDPILPGEPMYFRIDVDSAETVSSAIISAIDAVKTVIPRYFIPCPLVSGCVEESDIIGRLQNYFASTPEILPERCIW